MKYDNYLAQFEKVIEQANTEREVELMRKAVIEARALIERKAYAILQAEFKRKQMGVL